MTYPETIQYLESFIDYERLLSWVYSDSLDLDRFKDFLASINNPQKNLRCIHVAGSKGKGSTCAFIAYILRQAGFKVGLYTSPHLYDFRERIRILNPKRLPASKEKGAFEGIILKQDLARLVVRLKPAIDKYNKNSKYGDLTFFEVYTTLAFQYFKDKRVDFVVLETGLGGRLDATNAADALVCVITPISLEHTQRLGKTLKKIAREKAGIIKTGSYVITAPQKEEVSGVIRKRAQETKASLIEVSKIAENANLKLKLIGRHQLINASCAVAAVKALSNYNIKVSSADIKKGIYDTVWPGRCEVIGRKPWVVLDAAHNQASAQVLKRAIEENFKFERVILVLGISQDKDIKGICDELSPLVDIVVTTKSRNPRAANPRILAENFEGKEAYTTTTVSKACKKATSLAKTRDLILVTGSLFVVGEYRNVCR